jgi:hypothetical protein
MTSEKMKERNKKRFIRFRVGNMERIIKVAILPENIIEIDFDQIKSKKTKTNLLTLAQLYNIDWVSVNRYPVVNRFGYIVYGLMSKQGIPVTYVRKETYSRQSGSTSMYFDKYMLPALKLIQTHEAWPKKPLYWSASIDENAVRKWFELTHSEEVVISYQVSRFINGNQELRDFPFRKRKYLEKRLDEYFISIAKKLDSDRLMELIAILQKIQFEKL